MHSVTKRYFLGDKSGIYQFLNFTVLLLICDHRGVRDVFFAYLVSQLSFAKFSDSLICLITC